MRIYPTIALIVISLCLTSCLDKKPRSFFAEDGIIALEKLQQNTYDIVFMDCQMPDMDGYQTTRQIRQYEKSENRTPIIAISAHATQEARDLAKDAGMDDYLTKPVSLQNLQRMLDKWA